MNEMDYWVDKIKLEDLVGDRLIQCFWLQAMGINGYDCYCFISLNQKRWVSGYLLPLLR